jgi:hypothetical protein
MYLNNTLSDDITKTHKKQRESIGHFIDYSMNDEEEAALPIKNTKV